MARFLLAAAVICSLAYASLALPHNHEMENKAEEEDIPTLTVLHPGSEADNKFFFFPFNFWNGFKPLPWIPLPGLNIPTQAPPEGEDKEEDKDDQDKEEDKGDKDKEEDKGDKDKDEDGDENKDEEGAEKDKKEDEEERR